MMYANTMFVVVRVLALLLVLGEGTMSRAGTADSVLGAGVCDSVITVFANSLLDSLNKLDTRTLATIEGVAGDSAVVVHGYVNAQVDRGKHFLGLLGLEARWDGSESRYVLGKPTSFEGSDGEDALPKAGEFGRCGGRSAQQLIDATLNAWPDKDDLDMAERCRRKHRRRCLRLGLVVEWVSLWRHELASLGVVAEWEPSERRFIALRKRGSVH